MMAKRKNSKTTEQLLEEVKEIAGLLRNSQMIDFALEQGKDVIGSTMVRFANEVTRELAILLQLEEQAALSSSQCATRRLRDKTRSKAARFLQTWAITQDRILTGSVVIAPKAPSNGQLAIFGATREGFEVIGPFAGWNELLDWTAAGGNKYFTRHCFVPHRWAGCYVMSHCAAFDHPAPLWALAVSKGGSALCAFGPFRTEEDVLSAIEENEEAFESTMRGVELSPVLWSTATNTATVDDLYEFTADAYLDDTMTGDIDLLPPGTWTRFLEADAPRMAVRIHRMTDTAFAAEHGGGWRIGRDGQSHFHGCAWFPTRQDMAQLESLCDCAKKARKVLVEISE